MYKLMRPGEKSQTQTKQFFRHILYIYITLTKTKVACETSCSGIAASRRRDGAARYVCLATSSLESQHRAWRGRPAQCSCIETSISSRTFCTSLRLVLVSLDHKCRISNCLSWSPPQLCEELLKVSIYTLYIYIYIYIYIHFFVCSQTLFYF